MMWVWDSESKRMVNREIKYVPGFFKIVDEILVNAADNKVSIHSPETRRSVLGRVSTPCFNRDAVLGCPSILDALFTSRAITVGGTPG